jgi:hypothetical protein
MLPEERKKSAALCADVSGRRAFSLMEKGMWGSHLRWEGAMGQVYSDEKSQI